MAFSLSSFFDRKLTVSHFKEASAKLSQPLTAVLLSDLHGTMYGQKQECLLEAIRGQSPDLILMAGDMADPKVPLENFLCLWTAWGLTPLLFMFRGTMNSGPGTCPG